jgi:hypothetical protein
MGPQKQHNQLTNRLSTTWGNRGWRTGKTTGQNQPLIEPRFPQRRETVEKREWAESPPMFSAA